MRQNWFDLLALLATALPFVCASASAKAPDYFDDLVPLKLSSTSGSQWRFVPAEAKRLSDGMIRVWVKGDHSRDKSVKHRTSRMLFDIDCRMSKSRTLVEVKYSPSGRVLSSYNFDERLAQFEFIVPETMMSELQRKVCPVL